MVRVLRSGGYLIYSDFVFPSWLAKIGQFLPHFMGFPSTAALESLAAREGLVKIYELRRAFRADLIWLKNG